MSWGGVARAGDWTAWTGLPADASELSVVSELGLAGGERSSTRLGSRRRTLVQGDGWRYWASAEGTVVVVELEAPASALPWDELLPALGPAEREAPGRHTLLGATTTEYAHPSRGLALTQAESSDRPPSFEPYLAQVLLFAPTDLRGFVHELGGDDRLL